jgi:hypothetical protein
MGPAELSEVSRHHLTDASWMDSTGPICASIPQVSVVSGLTEGGGTRDHCGLVTILGRRATDAPS